MVWKTTVLGLAIAMWVFPQVGIAQQGTQKRPALLTSQPALKAQAVFREASQAARDAYALVLDPALKAAMAAGDLSEANAINSAKTALEAGGAPPTATFKTPRATQATVAFEAAMAKATAQFTAVLQAEQKAALAKGDLEEANAIDETIKAINEAPSKTTAKGEAWESSDLVVTGKGFTIVALENNKTAFSNRDYVWKGVPANLQGLRYTKANGGGHPQIRVRAKRNTDVQVFTDITTDAKVDLSGWERTGTQFTYNNGKNSRVVIFKKTLNAGQEIEIPQGNWAGVLVLLPKS